MKGDDEGRIGKLAKKVGNLVMWERDIYSPVLTQRLKNAVANEGQSHTSSMN